jgi:cell division protein FtsL
MTTKQDVQNQIRDLESRINSTTDTAEKRDLESQRDNLKQQLENL